MKLLHCYQIESLTIWISFLSLLIPGFEFGGRGAVLYSKTKYLFIFNSENSGHTHTLFCFNLSSLDLLLQNFIKRLEIVSLRTCKNTQLAINFVVLSERVCKIWKWAVKMSAESLTVGANKIQIFGCVVPKCLEIPQTKMADSKCLFGSQIQEVDGNSQYCHRQKGIF